MFKKSRYQKIKNINVTKMTSSLESPNQWTSTMKCTLKSPSAGVHNHPGIYIKTLQNNKFIPLFPLPQ